MLLIGFRPEERQEGIAPVEAGWSGGSQVAEQSDPFGLRQKRGGFTPGLEARGNRAKQPELDRRVTWEGRKAAGFHAARLAFKRCGQSGIALPIERNGRLGGRQLRFCEISRRDHVAGTLTK
jgi:hypothetical protein